MNEDIVSITLTGDQLRVISQAACELGLTREEFVLSMAVEAARRTLQLAYQDPFRPRLKIVK